MSENYRHHRAHPGGPPSIIFVPVEVPVAGSPENARRCKPRPTPSIAAKRGSPHDTRRAKANAPLIFSAPSCGRTKRSENFCAKRAKEIAMPNLAEAHLDFHRSLQTQRTERDAPAEVRSPPRAGAGRIVSRRDNATPTSTPVVGAGTAAPLVQALEEGME